MNEKNKETNREVEKNKALVVLTVLLVLIAVLSSAVYVVNHKSADSKNTEQTVNLLKDNNDICNIIPEEKLIASIKEYKDFGELIINDGPVFGLKEIVVKNSGEIFYSNCDGSLLFVGAVIDKTGRNLTRESIDKAVKTIFETKIKNIDKSTAIKMGNGKHELIVFTDPDCPYCRAAEAMFTAKPLDVTRYVFFTPLDSIHPDAAKKAIHVLCSADPEKELMKVIKNEITEFPNQCEEGKQKLEQHRKFSAELGVTGTPTFYLDGQRFVGADPKMYEIAGFEETDNKNKE